MARLRGLTSSIGEKSVLVRAVSELMMGKALTEVGEAVPRSKFWQNIVHYSNVSV